MFIGSQWRRNPGSPAVKPSVARRTYRARTVPDEVTARPGAIDVTRVPSYKRHTEPLHRLGQSPHQLGRLHPGAVRRPRTGQRTGHRDPVGRLRCRQKPVVGVSPLVVLPDRRLQPFPLRRRPRHGQAAVLDDVGLDALRRRHPNDLIDAALHLPLQLHDRKPPVRRCVPAPRAGEAAR